MGRLLILGLVAGLVPAAVQAQPAAPERLVPRESESNAVTGIVPERFIGYAALSSPRIWGNAMQSGPLAARTWGALLLGGGSRGGEGGLALDVRASVVAADAEEDITTEEELACGGFLHVGQVDPPEEPPHLG